MATVSLIQCIHRNMKPVTAQSVLGAMALSGHNVGWKFGQDADIGRSRSLQASEFLWNQAMGEVMVFVDDDISFSVDGFKYLVQTCLDTKEIVCGMYVVRDTAFPHPALALFPDQRITDMDREPVRIRYGATGFMAIHREALARLEAEYPWGYEIPVESGPRMMDPFFLEFIHEGEYLSEDFAFCQRAQEVGIATWCDPRIELHHNGERAYTLKDLSFNASMQQVTMTIDEGGPDPTGVLTDLASFWDVTQQEAWSTLTQHHSQEALAEEWRQRNPISPQEVLDFYAFTPYYVHDLAKFNMDHRYNLKIYAASKMQGRVIDFGGGIGTLSLTLAKGGRQVTYVDLPSDHRTFAEFRFAQHKLDDVINVVNSLEELPDESYDALIGIDVFEHIHPEALPGLVAEIHRVLRPGGRVVDVNDFRHTPLHPQHIDNEDLWLGQLESLGFVRQANTWVRSAGSLQPTAR